MQNSVTRKYLFLLGIIAWILFVLVGYYYYHKPISTGNLASPLSALLDIGINLAFLGLAGGIGRKILAEVALAPVERAVVQFCLGASILSLIWLGIGALKLYSLPLAVLILLAGWLLLRREILAWFKEFAVLRNAWKNAGNIEKLLCLLSAALVIFQLLIALSPPIKWDAMAYHLQLPRQYLASGGLRFVPENPYWGHPEIVEMMYTLLMSIHRFETAAVLNWSVGILILLGIFSFTNSLTRKITPAPLNSLPAGWIAVAALLAGFTFRYEMGWSYIDLFAGLFGLAALFVFWLWLENYQPRWFLWACFFSGLAMSVKWTSGVLSGGLFLATAFYTIAERRSWKELAFRLWLPGGLAALLVIAPWLIRNLVVTGSPLYPYFIGTPWFNAARLASANPPPEGLIWWQQVFLPLTTTITGVDSAPGFSSDPGPLLLLLALPGFWLFRRERVVQTIGILLIPAALAIGIGSLRLGHLNQTRLYYAVLPGLAAVAGLGWAWLQAQNPLQVRLRRIISTIILLVMLLAAWQDSIWQATYGPVRVFLGTQSRQSYLENTLGFHILAMQELEKLPPQSHTLFLWEPRGLYAPLNVQADLWIDVWRTDRREYQTASAILQHWKEEGFTHLLVYQGGVELIRPEVGKPASQDWLVFQELTGSLPTPKSIGDVYYLYRLPGGTK
jgi:4-amino-4-deoxy-L-arabinose transferase-like glycosyltransferase